ncbi:MAG: hypothetical protein EXQ58_02430 [Acidobacteria bacterium]|nr:hypothetical protein [Acidobacteriota bacterium]
MKNPLDPFKFWKRNDSATSSASTAQSSKPARAASAPAHASYQTSILKDFIATVTRKENPVVLDLGPVIGSNIEFFLNLGIKVYMEDFLAAYSDPKYSILADDKMTLNEQQFFSENFDYANDFFDGLICWDFLSYLEPKFARNFVERITAKMKPDSLVLGFFRTQKSAGPAPLHKYRISGESFLEYIPLDRTLEIKKVYQTRDVTQLFTEFNSQRFYLLKHHVLEVLLRKRGPALNP